jgi:Tol biopolymer transport system component
MKKLILLTVASACVPPGGSWGNWGAAGTGGGGNGPAAGTGAPPPRPNLVATGASKKLQRLTTDDSNNESEAVLSADGKWLLFTSSIRGEDGNIQANRIMRTRADGRGGVLLSRESGFTSSPSWLPSGNAYLAITDAMGSRDIVKALRVAPNAAMSRVLSGRDVMEPGALAVSPDGTQIAFHSQVGGAWTIGVSRIDGSELTHLVPGAFPAWSPDGKRLAFHRQINNHWQIFITDPEGGELTQVTEGDADDEQPTWSPDGKFIAFVSNRGWNRFPNADAGNVDNVYAIRADGTGLVALTDGARSVSNPDWGRDGKIYFDSTDNGSWDVWRLEPDKNALSTAQ